jgi:hypothetical protein
VTAAQQAVARAYNLLIQQATLFAYVDTFRRLGLLCLISLLFVLLLRRVAPPARTGRTGVVGAPMRDFSRPIHAVLTCSR